MKRAVTAALALAISLPMFAAETKSKQTDRAPEAATTAAEPEAGVSPMVAAARRANRLGKKPGTVITNETLRKGGSNAHVTTTQNQPEITPIVSAEEEKAKKDREAALAARAAEEKRNKAREEEAKKKSAEARRAKALAAAEALEEGGYSENEDSDPAQAEKHLQEAAGEAAAKPPED